MLKAIQKLLGGNKNEREIRRLWPVVEQINELAESFQSLTDEQLKGKTDEFKAKIHESVAEIEEDQEEIREQLQATEGDTDVGGDGQSAEGQELTLSERQDLYDQLDSLDKEWHDTVEDVLEEILPEAFAVVKETCRRFLGKSWEVGGATMSWEMVPYDVQLIGGIVLHRGNIAEMKTGEAKRWWLLLQFI